MRRMIVLLRKMRSVVGRMVSPCCGAGREKRLSIKFDGGGSASGCRARIWATKGESILPGFGAGAGEIAQITAGATPVVFFVRGILNLMTSATGMMKRVSVILLVMSESGKCRLSVGGVNDDAIGHIVIIEVVATSL